jgi:hypothetical protein
MGRLRLGCLNPSMSCLDDQLLVDNDGNDETDLIDQSRERRNSSLPSPVVSTSQNTTDAGLLRLELEPELLFARLARTRRTQVSMQGQGFRDCRGERHRSGHSDLSMSTNAG